MKKIILFCSVALWALPGLAQVSQNVNLLYQWHDTTITINFRDSRYSDVWGLVQNGKEYAVIGSTYGIHIFDVTDPSNAYQAGSAVGADQGYGINHRDYKDHNGYLYAVCDEGNSTLQVFDLSYLPDSMYKVYDDDTLFSRAHTIFIDTASSRLYACGTNVSRLSIYSILNPDAPQLLTHYDGGPYVHDIYVRNDTAYLNCGMEGLYVVDFQDPAAPVTCGSLTVYPDQGYNHSGWLNSTGDVYVFCDETYGREVKVCDVSDFGDIQIISTLTSGVSDSSIAHNAFIKGNYIYIAYYNDGLQIFDIADPTAPIKKGYYDTFPSLQKDDFRGAWGVYPFLPSGNVLVSDRNTGLYVFDVSQAIVSMPEQLSRGYRFPIYPNPTTQELLIPGTGPISATLYSTTGDKVMVTGKREINLASLDKGLYIISVTDKQGNVYVAKVLKE